MFRSCPLGNISCTNDYSGSIEQNKDSFKTAKNNDNSYNTICGVPYQGNYCHSCSYNYTKVSLNACAYCPDNWSNVGIIFIIVVISGTVLCFLIKTTVDSAFKPEALYSIGLKIFINYLQIIFLCLQYRISWPYTVDTFTSSKPNKESSEMPAVNYFFSLKCLLRGTPAAITEEDLLYVRLYFIIFLPLIFFIASGFMILILHALKKSMIIKYYKTVILIIPFLIVYPTILTESFTPLATVSLQDGKPANFDEKVAIYNESYLMNNRNISFGTEHLEKSLPGVIFGVIF